MIKIICVGKLKEKYLVDMVSDYEKRIKKYHKIIIVEVKDSDASSEGKLIMRHISDGDFCVLLDINGNNLDSISLSNFINNYLMIKANITFIIGGSNGVSEEIKRCADYYLSFGKNTYPHGLFRAVLLEQIYRSFKIINNESYHK